MNIRILTTLIVSKQSEGTKNDLQISDINLALQPGGYI